eukprot:CAMPEP_0201729246 /NCGR_PEP_ID=MMETSP0593-20130828/18461_1 /ASSEMBLY_ACC=CAM_ASM_000672 /TAXON_ID=267983 /ORGANISM="Skeletonema japonicum, Strain CCMP2506" /LENGTH=37 /DNA_ID= /DNA_START= /DNA_END= /DNA_ORIENTATION=
MNTPYRSATEQAREVALPSESKSDCKAMGIPTVNRAD